MKRWHYIFSAVMLAILVTVLVHAQSATIDLSLSTIPLDPQPGEQVTVTVTSYGADLSQSLLTWTYNNQTVASGTGKTKLTVTAPASGVTGNLTVVASGNDFDVTSATVLLRPASVDLLWEGADSYTPPFYKGRAIPSKNGLINIVAVPSINTPRSLSYDWTQNDEALQDASGYGKSNIILQNDTLTSVENIRVTEKNGSFSGSSSVSIVPGNPLLVGYFNNEGFVDYAHGSSNSLSTTDTGSIIHFEPYFFSAAKGIAHDLTFAYTDTDGNAVGSSSDIANELRLSRPEGGGQSQFTVAIDTVAYSLQNITKAFSINFN